MKSESTNFSKEYLTVSDIRTYLNISMTAAYELVHRKDFPVCQLGGSIRIPRDAFLAWVHQRTHMPDALALYMQQNKEVISYAV